MADSPGAKEAGPFSYNGAFLLNSAKVACGKNSEKLQLYELFKIEV
jgi:hypothetical protein